MTDTCQLHYEVRGSSEGPALLLLHGFMGSLEDWTETVAELPEFRCIVPDLAGHGRTSVCDAAAHYTMSGACADLIGLANQIGLERFTPVGYSMGGRLALYLACTYPDRCERVVVESASPGLAEEDARQQRRRWDEERAHELESWDFARFLRVWYEQPLFETLTRDLDRFQRVLERRIQNDPRALARSMRGMGTGSQRSLWSEIGKLEVPLLAISGELDAKYSKTMGDMIRHCKRGRHLVIPFAGHNVHCENPESYARGLKEFLVEG